MFQDRSLLWRFVLPVRDWRSDTSVPKIRTGGTGGRSVVEEVGGVD